MNYKDFLLRFFAVVGIVLPFLIGLSVWGLWDNNVLSKQSTEELPDEIILSLNLRAPLIEQASRFRLSIPALLDKNNGQSFFPLILALKRAKTDKRVKAIVADLGPYKPSLVHAQELAAALQDFRTSKKDSYIFSTSYGPFGPGGASYYLASQFKHIWLQPVGAVSLTGVGVEAPFAKSALKKWGIQTDFMRRKEYKSVMENISRDEFSPMVKKNMVSLFDSLAGQLAGGIAIGRAVPADLVKKWMVNGPYTAKESLSTKLITRIGYKDEMFDEIEKHAGKDAKRVDAREYLYLANKGEEDEVKATVAIIHAEGMIAETMGSSRMTKNNIIDTQRIVEAFETAAQENDIKAILFRVNSPGGSPVASETMRRAMMLAQKAKKPVFVSMGRVAASGGYWIAMNATHIIADPATITGSIGVIAGKPVFGEFFDRLGIKWDSFQTSDNASMWSMRNKFSDKQRARMNAMLDDTYQTFIENVATARKIPLEKMKDIAKGRVFTGEQALKIGLVDELGGLDTAVQAIKKELKLKSDDKIALVPLPQPETPRSMAIQIMKEFFSSFAMISEMHNYFSNIQTKFSSLAYVLNHTNGVDARLPPIISTE